MRIAVVGAQNTGKSTFLSDLLLAFPHYTSPKGTYRDLVLEKGLKINQETGEESQRAIRDFLWGQIENDPHEDVFFDRSFIDNYIYTVLAHERGTVSQGLVEETHEMMLASFDLLDRLFFIPTAVSVRLTDDELRDIDTKFIDLTNQRFIATLLEASHMSDIAIDVIAGTREERVAAARKVIS
jgi:GTPase SAR1 family protein